MVRKVSRSGALAVAGLAVVLVGQVSAVEGRDEHRDIGAAANGGSGQSTGTAALEDRDAGGTYVEQLARLLSITPSASDARYLVRRIVYAGEGGASAWTDLELLLGGATPSD